MARPSNTTEAIEQLASAFDKMMGGRKEMFHEALTSLVRLAKSEQAAEVNRDFFTCMDRKLP